MDRKKIILTELFYVLTAALAFFSGLELIWPGVVIAYFNLNLLLIFWVLIGIVILAKN